MTTSDVVLALGFFRFIVQFNQNASGLSFFYQNQNPTPTPQKQNIKSESCTHEGFLLVFNSF